MYLWNQNPRHISLVGNIDSLPVLLHPAASMARVGWMRVGQERKLPEVLSVDDVRQVLGCLHWTATPSVPQLKHARLSLLSSKVGTIRIGGTQPSTIFHPIGTKPCMLVPYYPKAPMSPLKRGSSNFLAIKRLGLLKALQAKRLDRNQ
jgi:hypothetical protein